MKKSPEQLLYDLQEHLYYDDLDEDERDFIEQEILELEDAIIVYQVDVSIYGQSVIKHVLV